MSVQPQATPAPSSPLIGVEVNPLAPGARQIYMGFRAQRSELRQQLDRLENMRSDLTRQLEQQPAGSIDRKGLEQRLTDVDQRISALDKQISAADAEVAKAAAIPGAVVPDTPRPRTGPPEEAFVLGGLFMIVCGLPITIAVARRIWRRGAAVISSLPAELGQRLTRIEQAVDAIAVEVERIGEGQRYVTNLVADPAQRALGAGQAEPIELKARPEEVRYRR